VDVTTTGADNITTSAARLKGRLESGNSVNVWFRYSTSSSVTCSTGTNTNASPSNVSGGTNFTGNISGLTPNTRYYYRACANGDSGDRLYFDTQEVTTNYTYAWEPGEWGSCINNIQTLDFDCVRYPGGDIVADNQCYIHVGPKPVETRECGVTGDDLTITTEPANVDENSATINGEVQTGETGHVFFVWNVESPNVDCVNGPYFAYVPDVNYPLEAGDTFSYTFPNNSITPNTTYHYKACARDDNNNIVSGIRREFTTDDNGGMQHPDANTQSPQDVGEDSAELRGSIDMNDFDNGIVFFVYGQDEDRIADVDNHYDTYNDVVDDEDNDQFEAEFVDGNFDGDDDFTEEVNNLEENERYYYQICVEYDDENNDPRLECGGVEDFETDNNNNNNNNDDTEIETDAPRNVTQTTAEMCGDLVDDGGNSVQTWIEFRNANQSFYNYTPTRQRREGTFCERVSGLTPNTTYIYRACTPDDCAPTRSFRTLGNTIQQGQLPVITTDPVTDIRSNSAVLNGTYVTNAPSGTCRFDYGRTSALGRSTRTYNVSGYGACVHSFTNLASNTQYCVQAVIETVYGTDRGSVRCFTTPPSTGGPTPPPVVVVEDDTEIDLLGLGLGISLVRLDIDDDEEVIIRGENIDYVVSWQNVSELDLFDLELKVVIPPEIQVTDISRGRFDQDENTIYFTIDELRGADVERNIPGEDGDMTISGLVNRGTVGNLVTAEAEISYDNPINDAREDAIAWDIDEYGVQVAGVTASVFGLGNITFLGWLVILLGLFIIFLVARWLYLEREEMRAQAYAGYMPYPAPAPYNGGYAAQANVPMYAEPDVPYMPPVASQPRDTYQPYRPNRG